MMRKVKFTVLTVALGLSGVMAVQGCASILGMQSPQSSSADGCSSFDEAVNNICSMIDTFSDWCTRQLDQLNASISGVQTIGKSGVIAEGKKAPAPAAKPAGGGVTEKKAVAQKKAEVPGGAKAAPSTVKSPSAVKPSSVVAAEPEMDDEPIEIMSDPAREAKLRERRKDPARAAAAAKFLRDL